MTQHSSEQWIVLRKSGNGGLCTTPVSEESLEGTRQLIDESNRRAVERGFKAEQFLICYKKYRSWYDDADNFVRSEDNVTAVELYPPTDPSMMKTFRFAVHNLHNDFSAFWVYKKFISAYDADRWAMRISFKKKNSFYLVSFIPE